ncbi:sigma-70 family RNA polymerase sigma factor [Psychrobacter sp.]|uniref:sigma-70 family RNA polymerase sigma factor n=1 Tax=Psychrobacter sp. TaxID=56811 RepID=UPI0025ED810A|nr:sigma-70 family RNA polymerase sigma factor [Psychrobacter sp.]
MSDVDPNPNHASITPEFVEGVRHQMLAFALLQLDDYHMAEDVVQDALLSALQYGGQFKGNSAFKSWVFAILKNKIVDHIRKDSKYSSVSSLKGLKEGFEEGCDDSLMDALFDEAGSWHPECKPKQFDNSWCDPEMHVHSEGFWQVLEACLTNLPSEQARAFLMKEYVELETQEICNSLKISSSNYYVLMHRARLGLQTCLTIKWFNH